MNSGPTSVAAIEKLNNTKPESIFLKSTLDTVKLHVLVTNPTPNTSLTAMRKWDTGNNARTQKQQEMGMTSQEVKQLESSGESVLFKTCKTVENLYSLIEDRPSSIFFLLVKLQKVPLDPKLNPKNCKHSKFKNPHCGFKNEKRRCTSMNGFSLL